MPCPNLSATVLLEAAFSDPVLQGAVVALAVALFGLVASQGWQAHLDRREQRAGDQAVLSVLLREVAMIGGIAGSVIRDLNREREMVAAEARWRLKPLLRFPTSTYDLIKASIPASLLKQGSAVPTIALLQTQCQYTNALTDEYQRWKIPGSSNEPDQIETILSFHDSIAESVTTVVTRCEELRPLLRAAGESVGGLNLEGPPPPSASGGDE